MNVFIPIPAGGTLTIALESYITVVDATGPFIELLGQKCTAAYYPIEDNKYLFKGKCNIPELNFQRMLDLK